METNLEQKQQQLQTQAQEVLEKLGLLTLLSRYGEPHIVGSMELGLMTWRDIDIEIIAPDLSKDSIAEIAAELIKQVHHRIDFGVIDNRGQDNPKLPRSIYLGLKYFGEDIKPEEMLGSSEKAWKIDLHFVLPEDSQGITKTRELKDKLTPEKRQAILQIKEVIATNPKYRKEVFSMDIYQAVLDHNVTDLGGFEKYLQASGGRTL